MSERAALLRKSFEEGSLRTLAVSSSGVVEWKQILEVSRAEVPWETNVKVCTGQGESVLTGGHRVFVTPTGKKDSESLQSKEEVLFAPTECGTSVNTIRLTEVSKAPSRQFMYDLTTDTWHNFVLQKSGLVVSNSPDKFYHFRPPEHEGRIGQYNRVFGQIWECEELLEYLQTALEEWNAMPPETEHLCSLDRLCSGKPTWKPVVILRAMYWALYAVAINWVADEFDYSIGGISLNLDKSSKYEQMKQNAQQAWEQHVEKKLMTTKIVRGLAQPRFGMGIRSAFGPHVGRGVLSPRAFLG